MNAKPNEHTELNQFRLKNTVTLLRGGIHQITKNNIQFALHKTKEAVKLLEQVVQNGG